MRAHRPAGRTARSALVVAVLVAAPLVASGPAPTAAAPPRPLCEGRPATIVGSPGARLEGTRKRDVVVSRGATRILTRGGDDLVCLTAENDDVRTVVRSGEGDDVVIAGDGGGSFVLGSGSDRFVGGAGDDHVRLDGVGVDHVDVALTGAGDDRVRSGVWDSLGRDRIELGRGDDALELLMPRRRPDAPPLLAGAGTDHLVIGWSVTEVPGPWRVDLAAGTATSERGGRTTGLITWRAFESVEARSKRGPAVFSGTDAPETFWVRAGDTVVADPGDTCRDGTLDALGAPSGRPVDCP